MTGHSGSGGRSVRRFLNAARPEDPRGRVRRDREPRASALERSSTPLCVRPSAPAPRRSPQKVSSTIFSGNSLRLLFV